ncbi:MAG: NAD(P)H-binding protein, partial [Candidatus Cybelea sp.]
MRVLVTGATGYIGGRLVPRLHDAGVEVRCVARAAGRLRGRFGERVEIVEGNLDDAASLVAALNSCDVAYYLVHSMAATADYAEVDRQTAQRFGAAAREAGVKAIVYLGGLGDDRDALSTHLRSRHEVGEVLRESGVPVIEFRAAQIIGSGSISFEMMRYLTERLPLMIAPRWVTTRCQPIGIRDVLAYLVAALSLPRESRIYEIGGSDVLTYREMMLRYAAIRGLKRRVVVVPFFSPTLSSYWVHLITPVPAK